MIRLRRRERDFDALSPHQRHRLMLWAQLRSLLTVVLMIVAYYVVPLDRELDVTGVLLLVGGLAIFVAAAVWQVRAILISRYPTLRAIQAMTVLVPFFLLIFAATYVVMSASSQATFTEPLTRTDSLYFTVTVFATVGFGDITPVTETARVVVMAQMIAGLLVLGLLLRAVVTAAEKAKKRQDQAGTGQGDDPAGHHG